MSVRMWRLLSSTMIVVSPLAFGHDIFEYQGPYTKAHGGAGVIMSRSGAAAMHNPANLWAGSTSDTYIDFSPSRLTYTVITPDPNLKPGVITIPVLPLTSFGSSVKSPDGPLAGGFIFIPTGVGTSTKLENFPVPVNGTYSSASVDSKQTGFKLGLGVAFKVNSNWAFGLSFVQDYLANKTVITTGDDPLLSFETKSRSVRPVVGLNYKWEGLARFSFVYQAASIQHYTLSAAVFDQPPQEFFRKNYRAAVFGVGTELEPIGSFAPFGQYTYERWVPATFLALAPAQALAGATAVEYLNSHNYILGTRYRLAAPKHLTFAFSSFGKNKGSGISRDDGSVFMQGRSGQDFEALDRIHLTTGYETSSKESDWLFYGTYAKASAISPPNTPSAGSYEMSIFMLGVGYVNHH